MRTKLNYTRAHEREELFDTRTYEAYEAGMTYEAFFIRFFNNLPDETRNKWGKGKDFAESIVGEQLLERYEELKATKH